MIKIQPQPHNRLRKYFSNQFIDYHWFWGRLERYIWEQLGKQFRNIDRTDHPWHHGDLRDQFCGQVRVFVESII